MTIATNGSASPRMPGPKLAALAAASMVLVAVLFFDSNERKQNIRDERFFVTQGPLPAPPPPGAGGRKMGNLFPGHFGLRGIDHRDGARG